MPVCTVEFLSRSLGYITTCTVIVPEVTGPYDVLIQLHGMTDSHTAWLYKSKLREYVAQLPLLVVLPNGGNYFWANMRPEARFESVVMEDIRALIPGMFHIKPERRWAIGGLSMGGYGALRLGIKHADVFASIWGHSSYIPTRDDVRSDLPIRDEALITDLDIYSWVKRVSAANLPRLSFDCGTEDYLLEHSRRFHQFLTAEGVEHTYTEHPGAHDWMYWDQHVPAALAQHCAVLGIEPPTA